jgi:SAM-dependent methyltransferase
MKKLLRYALGLLGYTLKRLPPDPSALARQFDENGRIPWSRGYAEAKATYIAQVLSDPGVTAAMRQSGALPGGFGVSLDERCVEYAWAFAQMDNCAGRLLDAGSVLNHAFLMDHPVLVEKRIHILTFAPEASCFWKKGVSYLYEDLRAMPLATGTYDTVVCLSTLEHIGMDNSISTGSEKHRENRSDDYLAVMHELGRVLKPEGRLLLTVPFGAYEDHRTQQQFDSALLDRAIAAFGGEVLERSFFRYLPTGWQRAPEDECQQCRYVEWVARHWAGTPFPSPLPVESDRAAAARAVACVTLRKDKQD